MKQKIKTNLFYMIEFCLVFLIASIIPKYFAQRTYVYGHSMENNFQNGDNVITNKIIYRLQSPERFDVITFYTQSNEVYIKRIIGLPNETIKINPDGTIYVNGEQLEEHFGKEPIQDPGRASNEITLGNDEYFVLGDNRNNSIDSRFDEVGNIKTDDIIGRVKHENMTY